MANCAFWVRLNGSGKLLFLSEGLFDQLEYLLEHPAHASNQKKGNKNVTKITGGRVWIDVITQQYFLPHLLPSVEVEAQRPP